MGSGEYGEFTFLDTITLISFVISLQNLNANLTQNDKQDLQKDLSDKADTLLNEIHTHLANQDDKLTEILNRLEKLENEKS